MRSVLSLPFMRASLALRLMAPLIAAQLLMVSLAFGQDTILSPA